MLYNMGMSILDDFVNNFRKTFRGGTDEAKQTKANNKIEAKKKNGDLQDNSWGVRHESKNPQFKSAGNIDIKNKADRDKVVFQKVTFTAPHKLSFDNVVSHDDNDYEERVAYFVVPKGSKGVASDKDDKDYGADNKIYGMLTEDGFKDAKETQKYFNNIIGDFNSQRDAIKEFKESRWQNLSLDDDRKNIGGPDFDIKVEPVDFDKDINHLAEFGEGIAQLPAEVVNAGVVAIGGEKAIPTSYSTKYVYKPTGKSISYENAMKEIEKNKKSLSKGRKKWADEYYEDRIKVDDFIDNYRKLYNREPSYDELRNIIEGYNDTQRRTLIGAERPIKYYSTINKKKSKK